MKLFFFKFIKTLCILFLILKSIEYGIDNLLSQESACKNNTWHQIFNHKINSDVVILGTSRAECHYDPRIIEKKIGLTTYNLGMSGTHYNILKIRWESYINHNNLPKIVILDIDASSLHNLNEIYQKLQYLPYFNTPEYQSVASKIDPDYYYEKVIPIYKYRGFESKIYKSIKSKTNSKFCDESVKGFIEHDVEWIERDYVNFKASLNNQKPTLFKLKDYSEGLNVLNQIITFCKTNQIKVVLIHSPSYHETHGFEDTKSIDKILVEIAKKNNITYHNYTSDSLCFDKKYFYNVTHLNKKGTTIFSEKVASLLQKE